MLAAALIDGSLFSGTKSVEVETPALKAAVHIQDMYAGVFPHVAKMLDLELTGVPKKLESLIFQHHSHRF